MIPELERLLREQMEAAQAALANLPPDQRATIERQLAEAVAQMAAMNPGAASNPFGEQLLSALGGSGEKYLPYRGDVKAVAGVGGAVWFVTAHPEGQPTALYRLDADSLRLAEHPLPCGGVALAATGDAVYIAGTDQRIYVSTGKDPTPLGGPLPDPVAALAVAAGDRLAVAAGPRLVVVSRGDGSVLQSLDLPDAGTCVAADRTGQWLAVGTAKGTVTVFDGQDKAEFEPAEAENLHDGAVTALLFEPDELRFFSAGADHKLLSTHARGRLEPEDKGRDNTHDDAIAAMAVVPGDRFVTGGRDAVLKTWPRAGGVKPAALKDGVGKVVGLSVVATSGRSRLAVACDDNSIRFVPLDADGRFGEVGPKVYGAVDRAKNELSANDPKRREKALKEAAGWGDAAGLDLVAARLDADSDHQIRLLAVQLLAASANPRAVGRLETAVAHKDEKVRAAAFRGLRQKLGPADPKPIDLALKAGHPDVGVLAVQALEPLAATDDQALARLTGALDHGSWDVRKAALGALSGVFAADPPRAGLTALGSKHGDVRAAAAVRFYERKLLDDPRVTAAVRRRLEDDDANVRRVAFLVSVLARKGLANYLRRHDPELHRQLNDLQGSDKPATEVPAADKAKLGPDDFDVPLQATAARPLDTCLRGARALAVLGDPRAFGLLLQLSREDDASARVEVCRALAALGDPRADARLRSLLHDPDGSVRDAAYSALAAILASDPLAAAAAGLTAAAEDVRRRGLETLTAALRKTPAGPGLDLLALALNDPAAGVRSEAWKAALNLKVSGGGEATLRFALKSTHADVRREVLTEVTAQPGESWATPLLYEFLNDPDAGLRAEAFAQATRKVKDLAPLEAAFASRFPDARRLAIDALIKKRTKPAQALLAKALHDADRDLRQFALAALVDEDAGPVLREAARVEHPDVRVRAAAALAIHGDPAALRPLLDLATAAEPTDRGQEPAWRENVEAALRGLAELGDPATVAPAQFLFGSKHAGVRKAAAEALAGAAGPESADALRAALSHSDPEVRHRAAFGLAALGDASVLSHLLTDEFAAAVGPARVLAAAVALGDAGERVAAHFLDHTDEAVRRQALIIHLLLELRDAQGSARRCLECLSAKAARTRLSGAQAIERFADPAAFRAFVAKAVNDRGDDPAWKVSDDVMDALSAVLAGGPPKLKARAVGLLEWFAPKEQAGWDQAWATFARRFAADIDAAKAAVPPRTKSQLSTAELRELAFGAYVGLVREQGSAAAPPAVVRVRQTALSRVFAAASADPGSARSARPVLTQALSDSNQVVRTQAFDHLMALGADPARLGADALESGHTDLAVKGLELLSAGGGDEVLDRVMLGRTDNLALEAAKLLANRRGFVPVGAAALDAVSEPLRQQAVQWLAAEFDKPGDAAKHLRAALTSRYRNVREAAAFELARKRDPAAFDALVTYLRDAEFPKRQAKAIEALTTLGDKRAAGAFLDRIETDPAGTAAVPELFAAAANFRDPTTADRLFTLADRKKEWRKPAFDAVLTVSGFDQDIDDPDDDRPDRKCEERQHPRHPAVLARLLDRVVAVGAGEVVANLIPGARWCRGPEVDAPLALVAAGPDAELRNEAIQALGWRLKHREASSDPLLKALRHKDPTTQFFAAEGLALGGRAEGINVLLSAVEYLDDVHLRSRAVAALGKLGDPRAVDVILRLAGEDGHALQEPAAEAVGHLRRSPEADKIGRLLERLAKGNGGVARRALAGLRWFDTEAGWRLLRQRAADKTNWEIRQTAAEQLGYNDEPATRDVLLKLLQTEGDPDVLEAGFKAARRLWGADSLDPHFSLLRNDSADPGPDSTERYGEDVTAVVCDRGDPLRIMEAFPRCPADVQRALEASLLSRPGLPPKAVAAALESMDEGTVRLAARLLARGGSADAPTKKAVTAALTKWQTAWADRRAKLDRDPDQREPLDRAGDALRALAWAAARTGAGIEVLAELAAGRPDDPLYRAVRLEVVRCLSAGSASKDALTAMERVARGTDPDAREIAADVLARHDPKRAAALIEPLASDRPSFARLLARTDAAKFAQAAAGQPHYQPVALPQLIGAKDAATLAAVAKDRKKPEAVRLGAVEGLGAMAAEPAERALAEVGAADGDDNDVRKAAWRALRRSKRQRLKKE